MLCPHCGREMIKGGLVAKVPGIGIPTTLVWYPEDEYEKKGLQRAGNVKGKVLNKSTLIPGNARVDDVYYCDVCNRVIADMPVQSDETKMPGEPRAEEIVEEDVTEVVEITEEATEETTEETSEE